MIFAYPIFPLSAFPYLSSNSIFSTLISISQHAGLCLLFQIQCHVSTLHLSRQYTELTPGQPLIIPCHPCSIHIQICYSQLNSTYLGLVLHRILCFISPLHLSRLYSELTPIRPIQPLLLTTITHVLYTHFFVSICFSIPHFLLSFLLHNLPICLLYQLPHFINPFHLSRPCYIEFVPTPPLLFTTTPVLFTQTNKAKPI